MTAGAALASHGLTKRYGDLVVLDNIDFAVAAGESVGIVGPNGAGKTTLLSILAGSVPASAGRILLHERDITRMRPERRCRQGIGRAAQVPRPFGGMTVLENVLVGASYGAGLPRRQAYPRCVEVLQLCGLIELANRRAESLGLLHRKRLELARSVATDPQILLLDEIGGGLTDAEAAELVDTIRQLRDRGIAIVWIEHIVHILVQVVERLVCMDAGRIIADGEPQSVLRDAGVVDAYLGEAPVMTLLQVEGLVASHGLLQAVRGISFTVAQGQILAVVGANGAGKSTLFRTVAGAHRADAGTVRFDRSDLTAMPAHLRVRRGIALVPEGRRLFADLTVEENLRVAGRRARPGPWSLDAVLEAFPMLVPLRRRRAASLSGGQQQAAAIARGVMTNPRLLIIDEVSLGLSPVAVDTVYECLSVLQRAGTTLVLVEQDLGRALSAADHIVCVLEGRIVLSAATGEVTRDQVTGAYFGLDRSRTETS